MVVVLKRVLLGTLCAGSLSACGEGLGECDTALLGGSNVMGMVQPHTGQDVVQSSCASGRCHSADAVGEARVGAPEGLNFDVFSASIADTGKVTAGGETVADWAEDMWEEIEAGTMPPAPPAGSGELNDLQKEQVRNWLACGAPIIPPDPSARSASWDSIWPVLSNNCVGCHSTPTKAVGLGFVIGENTSDICGSYANLMGKIAVTPMCSPTGVALVVPGDPNASLLFKKITDAADKCGPSPMPPTGALIEINAPLVGLIEQWILNGAPKPPSCP